MLPRKHFGSVCFALCIGGNGYALCIHTQWKSYIIHRSDAHDYRFGWLELTKWRRV